MVKRFEGETLRFGSFLPPFHPPEHDPLRSYAQDLELIVRLDELGFDEVWVGEHHSTGWEPVPSPEMFLAVAAARTRAIRLGTGVVGLGYHHPLNVAERMVFLDLLSRGRAMLGVGPGSLSGDASMYGVDPTTTRPRMDEALGVIMALLRRDGPVTLTTDWFEVRDAWIQLPCVQRPHLPVAVASTVSPAGAVAAGRHGAGLLSLGSYMPTARLQLANHWEIAEKTAATHGTTVDRSNWTLVTPMHVAETRDEAISQSDRGGSRWLREYYTEASGYPPMFPDDSGEPSFRLMAENRNAFVGSPGDVIEGIEMLWELTGGFGSMLVLEVGAASVEDRLRSYEMFAREVVPHFRHTTEPLQIANERAVAAAEGSYASKVQAQSEAHDRYFGTT